MPGMTPRQRSYFAHKNRVAEQEREFIFREHVGDLAGLGMVDAVWSNESGKPYHVACRQSAPGACIDMAADVDALCGGCGGRLGAPPIFTPYDGECCHVCGDAVPLARRYCRSCTEVVCDRCDIPSRRDDERGNGICRPCGTQPIGDSRLHHGPTRIWS